MTANVEVCMTSIPIDEEQEDVFQPDLFIDKDYTTRDVEVNGLTVKLEALHNTATTDFDLTGQIVWPASRLLALYLTRERVSITNHQKVLELGAGTGLAGIVAALLITSCHGVTSQPVEVTLTDNQEEVLKILQRNIDINFPLVHEGTFKPLCTHLSWADDVDAFRKEHGTYDVIIGADVIFWPSAVPLLFETAAQLLRPGNASRLIIAYISRSDFSTKLMFACAETTGFRWEHVDVTSDEIFQDLVRDQFDCGRIASILIFTKDSEKAVPFS